MPSMSTTMTTPRASRLRMKRRRLSCRRPTRHREEHRPPVARKGMPKEWARISKKESGVCVSRIVAHLVQRQWGNSTGIALLSHGGGGGGGGGEWGESAHRGSHRNRRSALLLRAFSPWWGPGRLPLRGGTAVTVSTLYMVSAGSAIGSIVGGGVRLTWVP